METDENGRVEGLLEQIQRKKAEGMAIGPPSLEGARRDDLLTQVHFGRSPLEAEEREKRRAELDAGLRPPRRLDTGSFPLPCEREFVESARLAGWRLDGVIATALSSTTLSRLAVAITGSAEDQRLLNFNGDPERVNAGEWVIITPLLDKMAEKLRRAPGLGDPKSMRLSAKGRQFLKTYEELRLEPYDDRTARRTFTLTERTTIGYGHLVKSQVEWERFKNPITPDEAERLFASDVEREGENPVRRLVTAPLLQHEFDALAILAFNIGGRGFAGSTVLKMINDPAFKSSEHKDLESAWKAWNSPHNPAVTKGQTNRRRDEWEMFTKGDYARDY